METQARRTVVVKKHRRPPGDTVAIGVVGIGAGEDRGRVDPLECRDAGKRGR